MTAQTSQKMHGATGPLLGTLTVPGDKSISHRSLMFAAVAHGLSRIVGLLMADDILATWHALAALGVRIEPDLNHPQDVLVFGRGFAALRAADRPLSCGNSGTTMRLLSGLLAGLPFSTELVGDASLQQRPMARIAEPLRKLGATVSLADKGTAPITLAAGRGLSAARLHLEHASGQVKGALLMAALRAHGVTELTGVLGGRDHTERMLPQFGASLQLSPTGLVICGPQKLTGAQLSVPGDISSACFWLAAAAMVEGSDVSVTNVGLNPTRLGFVRLLERMGAQITITPTDCSQAEPSGSIRLRYKPLRAAQLSAQDIPALIDELPLVALLATCAHGTTTVVGAHEARLKESDRLRSMAHNMAALGVDMQLHDDGFVIAGPQLMRPGHVDSFGDHRIAMTMAIAALKATAKGPFTLLNPTCVSVSYPDFFTVLANLAGSKLT